MKKVKIVMAFLLILTILIVGCLGNGSEEPTEPEFTMVARSGGPLPAVNGHTEENEETTVDVPFNETFITQATFKLTWTDTNNNGDPESAQDDKFTIEVTPPNGSGEPETKSGTGNTLSLTVDVPQNIEEPVENGVGWIVKITIEPGEGTTAPGFGRFIWYTDTGNDWALTIEYKYLEAVEETT